MLFPDDFAESITQCSKREGHLYIDGVGIEKIRIAEVQSMDALDKAIQEAMPLKWAERAAKQRESRRTARRRRRLNLIFYEH